MGCLSRYFPEEILEGEIDPTEPMNTYGSKFTNNLPIEDIGSDIDGSDIKQGTWLPLY